MHIEFFAKFIGMKFKLFFWILFSFSHFALAQNGFEFESKPKKKISIPFKLINNLIFIPIQVNGIELNFLLDTGVEETILLSLDDKEEISINNIEKIKMRGLGGEDAIEGLKSTNNILSSHGFTDKNHLLYIVLDQSFNFSSHIGIPVNGIIGYHFFKNHLIEINYDRKKIIVYADTDKNRKKINTKFQKIPITIEKNKPYLEAKVTVDTKEINSKLLLDIGNSDALWLFQDTQNNFKVPEKNFDDYLGKGFSGDIFGKRTRISKFKISTFEFANPIIAIPDSSSVKNVTMVKNRDGSVGGEILKRFSVVFDYKNNWMYLQKNSQFENPFQYNMSGVEIENQGMQWVQETVPLNTVVVGNTYNSNGEKTTDFKYKFSLKPVYTIANIRKNSIAESSGLQKGDIVVSINNSPAYKYTLQEINEILKSEEGKWLQFVIERGSMQLKFKFQLKGIL